MRRVSVPSLRPIADAVAGRDPFGADTQASIFNAEHGEDAAEHAAVQRWVLGIDAGEKTGIGLYDAGEDALLLALTLTFWETSDLLVRLSDVAPVLVVVEAPWLNKATFAHGTAEARKREKISRNVGANIAHGRLLVERCHRLALPCLEKRPTKGGTTKASEAYFRHVTGYTGRTSEHARDAALMVFGVRPQTVLLPDESPTERRHPALAAL